jgi:uncharacterized SAM-binding protein YcdF (DUF218 family)
MGSAVSADGRPGEAVRPQVAAALELGAEFGDLVFIPTGGIFPHNPCSEAEIMKELLMDAGVDPHDIIAEPRARNTLQNIIRSVAIIKKIPSHGSVIVCSDNYHIARSRILLRLLGISTIYRPMPAARQSIGWMRWAYFICREAIAIPIQVVLLLILKALRKA